MKSTPSTSANEEAEAPPTPAVPPPLSLAGLENSIAFSLRLAQAASFTAFARRTQEAGLRPGHYAIMHLIAANPGIAQTGLSRASGRDKSTLTPILADLSRQGLVSRRGCERDRRSLRLNLTKQGHARLALLTCHAAAHDAALDALIGPENKPILLEWLGRIAGGLDSEAAPAGTGAAKG